MLRIICEVHSAEGECLNHMELDFHKGSYRKRIAKTAWWAMHNGHIMTTRPVVTSSWINTEFINQGGSITENGEI